jgi:hypothetical protein
MPRLQQFCVWISSTPFSLAIRKSVWAFPIIESIHVLGIVLLVGSVALLDLRLLGFIMKNEPVSRISRSVLRWTWSGFAVMFTTGLLLSIAEAADNYSNLAFRIKLVLLFLVGLNPLIFHLTIFRSVNSWDIAPIAPWRARAAAWSSLVLWGGIVVAGRMIAYIH